VADGARAGCVSQCHLVDVDKKALPTTSNLMAHHKVRPRNARLRGMM